MADSSNNSGNVNPFEVARQKTAKVPSTPTTAVKPNPTPGSSSANPFEVARSKVAPTKPAVPATSATKPSAPKSEIDSFFKQKNLEFITPKNVNKKVEEANAALAGSPVFGPIISAASTVLNALQIGNAAMAGADYKRIQDNQKGIITPKDITSAALHGESINGKKVTSKIVNGQPVWNIKPTVTDPAKIAEIDMSRLGAATNNATAFTQPNRKTVYGADIAILKNPKIDSGTAALEGIKYDLTHDPLALVNPLKPLAVLKPLIGAAKTFNTATKTGDVSLNLIKDAVQNSDLLPELATKTPTTVAVKGAKGIPENLKGRSGKAAEVQAKAEKKLADAEIKTVKLTPEEMATLKAKTGITNPVLATALEAAKSAYTQIAVSQKTTKFLESYVKREVSGIRNQTPTAIIHPDFSGAGGFKILGGNGEELATATTRKGAQEAVKAIKKTVAPQGEIVPVEVALKAPEVPVMTTKQAIELTTQDGAALSLAKNVVHEATDGASYVFDGENVRKFTTTKDAQAYVKNSAEGLIKEATVLQEGKKWNVRQGDTITSYATKSEANVAAKKINTGQIKPARITTGAAPVLKSTEPTVSITDLAKLRPTSAEGNVAQEALKAVEKAVSEISGTQVGIKNIDRETLRSMVESKDLMGRLRILASATAKSAAESIRLASRLDGYNPVVMREALLAGTTEGKKALLRLIDGTPVITETGEKTTLGALLNVKKWDAGAYSAGTLKNMLDALDGIYKQITKAGKTSASGAKYAQIEKTFGKEIADQVKATGILEAGADQAAMDKYLALEKNLESTSKTTKYTSFEDVIKGLASGDSISSVDISKVITALDPAKKIVKQVEAAVEKNDVEFLKSVLSGEGIQAMNDIQKKILYTADFSNMLKVEGIGYDDVLSSAFAAADEFKGPVLIPNPNSAISEEFIRAAEAEESPEAFAQLLSREVSGPGDIATEALNTAFKKLGANLDDIAASRGSLDTISLYGDITSRVSKKAWTGRAALPEQLNQVADAYIASSINGIVRDRYGKAKKFLGTIEDYLFDETIKEFDKVSAALGLLGLRIQRNKVITALTKKAADPKHLVYLHTGDIFKAFDKSPNGRQAIKDAFYSGGADYERDSFLHQNLGEGARYVLEQDASNAQIDMVKLTELVQNGVATPALKPTTAFEAKIPALAQRLAEQLANPIIIKAMKESHLTKSIGLASRVINQTHSVVQDIYATVYDAIRLNALNGDLSAADMTELMRGHLGKLATAGNFFNLSSGPVANAAFRSWSQIIALRGKIAGADLLDKQEWNNFRTAMNDFAKVEKTLPSDSVLIPKHTVLTKKQMTEFLKKEKVKVEKAQADIILTNRDNVASQVIEDLDAGNFDKFDVPAEDMPEFVMQAMHDRAIKEETTWGVPVINPQLEEQVMQLKTKYAKSDKGRFKKIDKNDLYIFNGREDLAAAMVELQTKTYREEHEFVKLAMMAEDKLKSLPEEDFNRAFSLLRDGVKLTEDVVAAHSAEVLSAHETLKPVFDLLFGSKETNGFAASGISGKWLQRELDQVGLNVARGFKSVKDYAVEDLYAMARELPFGERPKHITGTGEISAWEKRVADFKNSGLTPLLAFTKVAQAAGSVRFQVGMARGLYSRFSHTAAHISPERANRLKWVKIVTADEQSIAINAIPEGAMFPPNIAEQYGQTIRDYDYARNATHNKVVRTIIQLTGVSKALWTVINPGHHLNTFTGTMNQLVMKGVVNSKRYETGFRMSGRHFADRKLTNWQSREKLVNNADAWAAQIRQAFDAAAFDTSSFEGKFASISDTPAPGTGARQIAIIENGKAVGYSEEYIQKRFEEAGLIEEPVQQQDLTNLQNNMLPDLNSIKEAELVKKLNGKKQLASIKQFEENITRKPALIGAWHGNALRVAEALDVMQKRSWKNLDEAINAAIKEVMVSQPTSKSLAPFERKWGPMGTSFYTWARMNQVVMLRMFAQNNREINIAQDLLYNINVAMGYTPQNTGTPYPNTSMVPSYLGSKAGGVVVPVAGVPVLMQPALNYNDGMNFWGLQVDASKPLMENIIGISNGRPVGMVWQIASIPAKNMSIAANLVQKAITQRNPQTGQGLNVQTPLDLYREFLLPLAGRPGQIGAAITNVDQAPDKSILTFFNYLTGARATNLIAPSVQKVAKIEQGQRQNEFLKRLGLK